MLKGQAILVTAAGGTIGSAIVNFEISRIIMLDHSGLGLFSNEQASPDDNDGKRISRFQLALPISASSTALKLCSRRAPSILFSTRCLQACSSCRRESGVRHSQQCAELPPPDRCRCEQGQSACSHFHRQGGETDQYHGSEQAFVSDGSAANHRFPETRFSVVRFGNVLGSSGYMLPFSSTS